MVDDIPLKLMQKGDFIINAPAVENAGSTRHNALEKLWMKKQDKGLTNLVELLQYQVREQVDIMISRGEVVHTPKHSKKIGYDRLEEDK